jgi:hypothetical protein
MSGICIPIFCWQKAPVLQLQEMWENHQEALLVSIEVVRKAFSSYSNIKSFKMGVHRISIRPDNGFDLPDIMQLKLTLLLVKNLLLKTFTDYK